jgi:D-alanyl-D-alanine endopeptidase (penicillin-binding protein 7)
MLVSSDNMAAFALSRSLPNVSREQFIALMNKEAKQLHMNHTHFVDPAGLNPENVSTVSDLSQLIQYSIHNPIITSITSQNITTITKQNGQPIYFKNSNKLVRELGYKTTLSKTGHINEAGYNLVFSPKNTCNNKNLAIISLGSSSSNQRCQFAINKLNQYNCNV